MNKIAIRVNSKKKESQHHQVEYVECLNSDDQVWLLLIEWSTGSNPTTNFKYSVSKKKLPKNSFIQCYFVSTRKGSKNIRKWWAEYLIRNLLFGPMNCS